MKLSLRSNVCMNMILTNSLVSTFNFPSLSLSPRKQALTFPRVTLRNSQPVRARKTRSESDQPPILGPSIVEEVFLEDDDDELIDDDDDFDYVEEEFEDDAETQVGDGGAGGGISLAGTWWDRKALEIAQEVSVSFDGVLDIYAFKTLSNSAIRVRIENLSKKSGSPSMEDIEAFTATYRARLDEAELAKSLPENIFLEVSSPGVERVVRIPQDLDRFKERTMYVRYVSQAGDAEPIVEGDGVFRLVSFDTETKCCTWGLADVRVNREKAGKGRPLSKKQREWRLDTPFESLRLVRLYSEM